MRIELAFGHYQDFQVEPLRVSQLLEPEGSVATSMGIKDKLTDYFRIEKKSVALVTLHELLCGAQAINQKIENVVFHYALTAFNTLASLAATPYQELFHIEFDITLKRAIFSIDKYIVKTLDFSDILDNIYINGKHFLNCYGDILFAHAVLRAKLLNAGSETPVSMEQACETESAACFYRAHPRLKTLLLQCYAQDSDNMHEIIQRLTERGTISVGRDGRRCADMIARHLCEKP